MKKKQHKFLHQLADARLQSVLLALLTVLLINSNVQAQMFSADEDSRRGSQRPATTTILVGVEPLNVEYDGATTAAGAEAYTFNANLLRLRIETPIIKAYLGTAGSATGLDDYTYFDAGVKYRVGIPLLVGQQFTLQLPLQLHGSITNMATADVEVPGAPEFGEGTVEAGLGLAAYVRLHQAVRLKLNAVPSYGFAFSTREQNAGGSVATAEGQARLFIDNVFGSAGLSLGYDYRYRSFNIEDERLDYNLKAHSFLIGINF